MAMAEMSIMSHEGDTKILWDKTVPAEVENAKRTFDDLRASGYLAFKVEGKDGRKGEVIRKFDPEAERLIMAPPMAGG